MIKYPLSKINLGLQVFRKRSDGYHDIDSVFYPIHWCDILEANVSKEEKFVQTGLTVQGNKEDNLVFKAYQLLKKDFPEISLQFHLHKILPMGAGLGGGSSDAAFALLLINELGKLNLSEQKLLSYAAQLGSDCSFFISKTCAWINGRGDQFEKINFELQSKQILIVFPSVHISTSEAFSGIKPITGRPTTHQIVLNNPIEEWKNILINDFEKTAFEKHQVLAEIKKSLYQKGAIYASMSGSGSALYGIFNHNSEIDLSDFSNYYIKLIKS